MGSYVLGFFNFPKNNGGNTVAIDLFSHNKQAYRLASWLSEQKARLNGRAKGNKILIKEQISRLRALGIEPNIKN